MFEQVFENMASSMVEKLTGLQGENAMKTFADTVQGFIRTAKDIDLRLKRVEAVSTANFEMCIAICEVMQIVLPETAANVKKAREQQKQLLISQQNREEQQHAA